MQLYLNARKLVLMFWPVYALMALGAVLNPAEWLRLTPVTLGFLLLPLTVFVLGLALRERWRLELTAAELVHHALFRTERFAWDRMGPVEIRAQTIFHLPLVRTLWLPFPTDAPRNLNEQITKRIGRRLLLAFGDRSSRETLELIEAWRRGDTRMG